MLTFSLIGPVALDYKLTKRKEKRISTKFAKLRELRETKFWKEMTVEATKKGFKNIEGTKGLYIFGMRAGKGIIPYYVGQTKKSGLAKEPFTKSNRHDYNDCMSKRNGTPVMFFLLLPIRRGKDNYKVIDSAERFFIEMAFLRNPDGLINVQHAKEDKWSVESIIRSTKKGKPAQSAAVFKKMMGL